AIQPVKVTINPLPTATITGGSVCAGSSKTLNVVFTGNGSFSFTYSDGSTTKTVSNVSSPYQLVVKPLANTTYTITSVSDASCTNSSPNSSALVTVVKATPSMRYPSITASANK